MLCLYCSQEVLLAEYCSQCGARIACECPVCDQWHPKGTKFCPNTQQNIDSFKKLLEKMHQLTLSYNESILDERKQFAEKNEQAKNGKIYQVMTIIFYICAIDFSVSMVAGYLSIKIKLLAFLWNWAVAFAAVAFAAVAFLIGITAIGYFIYIWTGQIYSTYIEPDDDYTRGLTLLLEKNGINVAYPSYWYNKIRFSKNFIGFLEQKISRCQFLLETT